MEDNRNIDDIFAVIAYLLGHYFNLPPHFPKISKFNFNLPLLDLLELGVRGEQVWIIVHSELEWTTGHNPHSSRQEIKPHNLLYKRAFP